jgi:hypothetical protein
LDQHHDHHIEAAAEIHHHDVHLEEPHPERKSSHCSQEEPEICLNNEDEECKRLEAEAHAE